MEKLIIEPGKRTPGIMLSPAENIFRIYGTSSPEDVRKMYYPVIEWFTRFMEEVMNEGISNFSDVNLLKFQIDLSYFNSSSAKFLADILTLIKKLPLSGIPVVVEWHYDEDDIELKETGVDFASLVEMDFTFVSKQS